MYFYCNEDVSVCEKCLRPKRNQQCLAGLDIWRNLNKSVFHRALETALLDRLGVLLDATKNSCQDAGAYRV